jgi:hypothetical protein
MTRTLLPIAALAASLLLAGCASFSKTELAQVRQQGVSAAVVNKMETGHPVTPAEVIELTRHNVPENLIFRQIDDTGLDYILTKADVTALRAARVSPAVIDALLHESERFARSYNPGFGPHYVSPYDDVIYEPDPYRYTGDATVGVGFSSYRGPQTYDPYIWRR